MHVLATGVGAIDAAGGRRCVPSVDGSIELHARIGGLPSGLGELTEQIARLDGLDRLAGSHGVQFPIAVVLDSFHEFVSDADRDISVLVLDAEGILAVQAHLETGSLQGARLALLDSLAPDEFLDVGVVNVQGDHLGSAAGLTAALDGAGAGVSAAHETQGAAGQASAAAQGFGTGTDSTQVDARTGTTFENQAFFNVPVENRWHGVFDAEDETGAGLLGTLRYADVKPDRAIKGSALGGQHIFQF